MPKNNECYILAKYTLKKCPQNIVTFVTNIYFQMVVRRLQCHLEIIIHQRHKGSHTVICFVASNREILVRCGRLFECTTPWFGERSRCSLLVLRQRIVEERLRQQSVSFCLPVNTSIYALYSRQGCCGEESIRQNKLAFFSTEGFYKFNYSEISDSVSTNLNNCLYKIQSEENLQTLAKERCEEQDLLCKGQLKDIANGSRQGATDDAKASGNERTLSEHLLKKCYKLVDCHNDHQQTHCSSVTVHYLGGFLHNTTGHNVVSPMDKEHYEQLIHRPPTKPFIPNVNLDVCQRRGTLDKMENKLSDTQPSPSAKNLKVILGLTTSKDVSLIPEDFPSITCSCEMGELSDRGGTSVGNSGQKRSRSVSIRRSPDELNRCSNAVGETSTAKPQQPPAERHGDTRNRAVLGGQSGPRLVHDLHPCNNQSDEFSPPSRDATDKHTSVTSMESSPLNNAVKRPEEPVVRSRLKTPLAQQHQQQRRLQLTQQSIAMSPQSPKRLIRMNEVKRGKACEYSVGRTFTGACAGRDVTTHFIATCTNGLELESEVPPWAEQNEEKVTPLNTQISPRPQWTNSTDLYSAPLCEQGTQNVTRHMMAARPTVQQVVNSGMPNVCVGRISSITSQVLPTYRVRSCGVQANVTHTKREEQCQTPRDTTGGCSPVNDINMLRFDPKRHFVHSPTPSNNRMINLITQIARGKKTPSRRKKCQPSTKFASAKSYSKRPVTHSQPEVITAPYADCAEAIVCGPVMKTQSSVDDMEIKSGRRKAVSTPNSVSSGDELVANNKMSIIPAYVQRTESWSYWPRTVIYPPVSKAFISGAWNPVNSRLDGTGNIDLKSGRSQRSSDLLRSRVFASGESKHITSSDSDRDLHEPLYSTTPRNKEPAKDLDAPHSHSSLSDSFSTFRKSLISTWSTDSAKLRICAVQRRADLYRPTCVGEFSHRASVIVNNQKAVKPELVQAHKVVDIRIDPNPMLPDIPHTYTPPKASVDSNEGILKHATYDFSKQSKRRGLDASAQIKPTPGETVHFAPDAMQVSEIHAGKSHNQTLQFPMRLSPPTPTHFPSHLTKNSSWDHISTGGNPPIQPVVPLRCRRSESPNHAPRRKSVSRSRSDKGRAKSGSRALSFMNRMFVFSHPEPPSIMSLSTDNQIQETTLNADTSPAASTSFIHSKFIRRGRSKSHNIPVGLSTQTRSAVRMSAWDAQPHSTRRSKSVFGDLYPYAFRSDIRREHHASLARAHFQELRKMVEAYFSGHGSSRSSLDSIRTTNRTKTSAPGGPMDHICSRYFRTITDRSKSCEIKQTATQAWTTISSASREYSGLARKSPGNGESANERSTWSAEMPNSVPISISPETNAFGRVPTQTQHQDMLRTATHQSPVSDAKYISESSCKDNSICTTCASTSKNQADKNGFKETAAGEIKAVDQRIGEALHGTLERILFESVDKLSSLRQSNHTERPIKLVSKLEFLDDHTEDGDDVRKGPSIIRSYEFVHTEPRSAPGDDEPKILLVDKIPMVIGTDKTDEVEELWRKTSNPGLERSLWCCKPWRKSLSTSSK